MTVDGTTGKPLCSLQTSQLLLASPMTYSFDSKQHFGVAAGPAIISFGLGD